MDNRELEMLMERLISEEKVFFIDGEDHFTQEALDQIMDNFVQTDEFLTDYDSGEGIVDKVGAEEAAMIRAKETTAFQVSEFENEPSMADADDVEER